MSKIVALSGEERSNLGTGAARALRREHFIPAIIYGGGKKEILFSLPKKEISMLYEAHGFFSHIYEISIAGKTHRAIPKHVQLHPVNDRIEHIDFIHVAAGSKVKVPVEIEFINKDKSSGIKAGGILSAAHMHVELLCDPAHIPEILEIDVLKLELGAVIHAGDLKLPKHVELAVPADATICTMSHTSKSSEDLTKDSDGSDATQAHNASGDKSA
jgi:large subunit ribosomal protein L25